MSKGKTGIPKTKAFGYVRVSDPRQVENTSLDNQERAIHHKAQSEGLEIVKVFIEGGKSASKASASRKEFHRMLAECEEHQDTIAALVVWKYDRFARDPFEHFTEKTHLLSMNIKLISVVEPSNETMEGELIEGIMASVARAESKQLSLRSRAGVRRVREQGRLTGPAPVGYVNVKHETGNRIIKSVEIDPRRASLIRKAFELFETQAFSKREIVDKVNALGFAMPRTGKPLLDSRLEDILRNPTYAARIYVDRDDDNWIPATFPAIVSGDLFDRVQQLLRRPLGRGPRSYLKINPEFPLKRFVRCAYCGSPLTGGTSKGKGGKYSFYRCYNPQCYETKERKYRLEERFVSLLDRAQLKPGFLALYKEVLRDLWVERRGDAEMERRELRKQELNLNQKLERLIDLRCGEELDRDTFERQRDKYRADLANVKVRLSELGAKTGEVEKLLNSAFEVLSKAGNLWKDSDIDNRLRLQDALFPEGVLYESKDGFLNPPMSKAFNMLDMLNASEPDLVAGTLSVSDLKGIPVIKVRWKCEGSKQGAKKLKRCKS